MPSNTVINSDFIYGTRLFITYDQSFPNNLYVGKRLIAPKDVSLNSRVFVSNDGFCRMRLYISNDVSFNNRLYVNRFICNLDTSNNSRLFIGQNVSLNSNAYINGIFHSNSDISANSRMFIGSDVSMSGNLLIGGTYITANDVSINSRLFVKADVSMVSNIYIYNKIGLSNDFIANSRVYVNADVSLNANGSVNGQFLTNKDVSLNSRFFLLNNASFGGNLFVKSRTYLLGDLSLNSRLFLGKDASFGKNMILFQNGNFNTDISSNSRVFIGGNVLLGGNIFIKNNITNSLDASFGSRVFVGNDVSLGGNAIIGNNVIVVNDISSNSRIYLSNDLIVGGNLFVNRTFLLGGDVSSNSRLFVSSDVSLGGGLNTPYLMTFGGDISFNSRVFISGNSVLSGNLFVNRIFVLGGDVSTNSRVYVQNDSFVLGNTYIQKKATGSLDLSSNSRIFVFNNSSFGGNAYVLNNSTITNDLSINSRLFVNKNIVLNRKLYIKNQSIHILDLSINNRLLVLTDVYFQGMLSYTGRFNVPNIIFNSPLVLNSGDLTLSANLFTPNFNSKPLFVPSLIYSTSSSFTQSVTGINSLGDYWNTLNVSSITSVSPGPIAMSSTGQYSIDVSNGLWISTYYGSNWYKSSNFTSNNLIGVAISGNGQYSVLGDTSQGIFYSNNYGQSWTNSIGQIAVLKDVWMFSGALAVNNPIYPFVSYDGLGLMWTNLEIIPPYYLNRGSIDTVISFKNTNIIYANGIWACMLLPVTNQIMFSYSTNGYTWTINTIYTFVSTATPDYYSYSSGGYYSPLGGGVPSLVYGLSNGQNIFNWGCYMYSVDGIAWTLFVTNPTSPAFAGKFVYGSNGNWVRYSSTTLQYSINGYTWVNSSSAYQYNFLTYGNNEFYGIYTGSPFVVGSSSNGQSWSIIYSNTTLGPFAPSNATSITGITYGGGNLAIYGFSFGSALSPTIYAYSNNNGISWISYNSNDGYLHLSYYNNIWILFAKATNPYYVSGQAAPPYLYYPQYSTDLNTWTRGNVINSALDRQSNSYYLSSIFGGVATGGTTLVNINISITSSSWSSVSMSNLNTALSVANGTSFNGVYYSSNSGQFWRPSNLTSGVWSTVCIAYNSTNGVAGGISTGIYYSINAGIFWNISNISNNSWMTCKISSTGNYAIAGGINTGIYYSTNSGITWFISNINSTISIWNSSAMSSSGQYCIICPSIKSSNSSIYYSTNYGQIWILSRFNSVSNYISMSQDGQLIIASPGQGNSSFLIEINQSNPIVTTSIYYNIPGTITFTSDLSINSKFFISGNANICGNLNIPTGVLSINTDLSLNNRLFVSNNTTVYGNSSIYRIFLSPINETTLMNRLFLINDLSMLTGNVYSTNFKCYQGIQVVVATDISMNRRLFIYSDASINGNLFVFGKPNKFTTVNSRLFLGSDLSISTGNIFSPNFSSITNSNVNVFCDISNNSRMFVKTDTSMTGNLFIRQNVNGNSLNLTARLFMNNNLHIGGNIYTPNINSTPGKTQLITDVSFNNRLFLGSDFNSTTNISVSTGNISATRLFLLNDLSMNRGNIYTPRLLSLAGSASNVLADVSANSRIFISTDLSTNGNLNSKNAVFNLDVNLQQRLFFNKDLSISTGGFYSPNITSSFITNFCINTDLSLNRRLFCNKDVSFNGNLSIFINNNSIQGKNVILLPDVSANNRLFVRGDVSSNGNMFVSNNTIINRINTITGRLFVGNDLSMARGNIYTPNIQANTTLFNLSCDLSLNSRLFVRGNVYLGWNINYSNFSSLPLNSMRSLLLSGDLSLASTGNLYTPNFNAQTSVFIVPANISANTLSVPMFNILDNPGIYSFANYWQDSGIKNVPVPESISLDLYGAFIMLVANNQLWISSNYGVSFNQNTVPSLPSSPKICARLFRSTVITGTICLIADLTKGIYYTTNLGLTWTQTNITSGTWNSINYDTPTSLAIAASNNGLYYSTNSGKFWFASNITDGRWLNVVDFSPKCIASPDGTTYSGIYYSTNSGKFWIQSNINYGIWSQISFSPFTTLCIAAGVNTGIYYSTNYGIFWNSSNMTDNSITWNSLCFISSYAIICPSATTPNSTFYFSTNSGVYWSPSLSNLPLTNVYSGVGGGKIFATPGPGTSTFYIEINTIDPIINTPAIYSNIPGKTSFIKDVSSNSRLFINNNVYAYGKVFTNGSISLNRRLFLSKDLSMNSGNIYSPNFQSIQGKNISLLTDLNANVRMLTGGDTSFNRNLTINTNFFPNTLIFNSKLVLYSLQISPGNIYSKNLTSIQNVNVVMNTDISLNSRFFIGSDASFGRNLTTTGGLGGSLDASFNNRLFLRGDLSMTINGNIYTPNFKINSGFGSVITNAITLFNTSSNFDSNVKGISSFGKYWNITTITAVTSGSISLSSTGQYAITVSNGLWQSSNYGYNWQQNADFLTNNLVSTAMSTNGQWSIIGDQAWGVYYSVNGNIWTVSRGPSIEFLTINNIIVAARTGGALSYTVDGYTWTNVSDQLFTQAVTSIYFANSLWIANCSTNAGTNTIITSINGINWTTSNFTGEISSQANNIIYGNGIWITLLVIRNVTLDSPIAYSSDGTNWIKNFIIIGGQKLTTFYGITFGNGIFLLSCRSYDNTTNCVIYSVNGLDWTYLLTTTTLYGKLIFGNGIFIINERGAILYTSTNGIIWIQRFVSMPNAIYDVLYGGNKFVAAGSGSYINGSSCFYYSSNSGNTWVALGNFGYSIIMTGLAYINNVWTAFTGAETSAFSTNGINWTLIYSYTNNKRVGPAGGGANQYINNITINMTLGNWSSISISSTSNNAIASVQRSGFNGLYYSTNNGQFWTISNISSRIWSSVSIASSGGNSVAGGSSTGIYYSTSYGQFWIISNISNNSWNTCQISSNGIYAIIAGRNTGIYYSTSGGQYCTVSNTNNTNIVWNNSAMSSSGQYCIICPAISSPITSIYYSINYGQTWSSSQYNSISNYVAVSQDGQLAIASPGLNSTSFYIEVNQSNPIILTAATYVPVIGVSTYFTDVSINRRLFIGNDVSLNGNLAVRQNASYPDVTNAIALLNCINYNTAASNTAYISQKSNNPNPILLFDTSGTSTSSANYIQFNYQNVTGAGAISGNDTTVTYTTGSDYRLKQNIFDLSSVAAIDILQQLRPVSFQFKSQPEETIGGFLAHELQTLLPHTVIGEKDQTDISGNHIYQSIDTKYLIPYLVKNLQTLQTNIIYGSLCNSGMSVYQIPLEWGTWLIESSISFQYDSANMHSMETISLSVDSNKINTDQVTSTPVVTSRGSQRKQISGIFRVTEPTIIYTIFYTTEPSKVMTDKIYCTANRFSKR